MGDQGLPNDEADKSIKTYFNLMNIKPDEKFINDLINFPAKNIITVLDCIIKNNPDIEIKEDDDNKLDYHIEILKKLCDLPLEEAYKRIKDYFTLMRIKPYGNLIINIKDDLERKKNTEIYNIIMRGLNRYADDSKMQGSYRFVMSSTNAIYIATATQYIKNKFNALIENKKIASPYEPYEIVPGIEIWKSETEIFYIKEKSMSMKLTIDKDGVGYFDAQQSPILSATKMLQKVFFDVKSEPLQKIIISDTDARKYQTQLKNNTKDAINFEKHRYKIKMDNNNENLLYIFDPILPEENQILAVINFEGQENGKVEVLEAGTIGLNTGEKDPSKWKPYEKREDIVMLAVRILKNPEQENPFLAS